MTLDEKIQRLGVLALRPHFGVDEDGWYSCPKHPSGCLDARAGIECTCGADEHNAEVAKILASIEDSHGMNVNVKGG